MSFGRGRGEVAWVGEDQKGPIRQTRLHDDAEGPGHRQEQHEHSEERAQGEHY